MKKTLLSLGLLALAYQSSAQLMVGPRFTALNPTAGVIPPSYGFSAMHTVDANTMWAVVYDGSGTAAGPTNSYLRTTNAAGDLEFGSIFSAQNPGFSTANIHGISATTALASTFSATGPGGEVLRTTNGGLRWTRQTTAAQFAAPDGFNNLVYLASNNLDGFAFGDPNGGGYEVLVTTDGGVTWTRNNSAGLTPVAAGEFGLTQSFFGRDRNVWAGGGVQGTGTGRVFRNTNAGQGAWAASDIPAPFAGTPTDFAFRDNLNGLAMNRVITGGATTGVNLAKTTDGGVTWTVITPGANFYYFGLDASCGKFISYGRNAFGTPNTINQYGYSTSTDGITWTLVQDNFPMQVMDVLDGGPDNGKGYSGYFTANTDGTGGVYKTVNVGACPVLPTKSAAVQKALSVHPNPSADGVFTLSLNDGLKAGTVVRVVDMLGREVYNRELGSSAINTRSMTVDLSQQKAGVYSLEIRTTEGNAQQKLVIQ